MTPTLIQVGGAFGKVAAMAIGGDMGGAAGHGSTAAPPEHDPFLNEYHEAPGPAGHSRWPSLPAAAGGGWAARRSLVVVLVLSCWMFLRFSA